VVDDPAADVKLSWWNKEHQFAGGNHGALVMRDTGTTDGGSWLASVAAGMVLVSQGSGAAPAYTARPLLTTIKFLLTDPASPTQGEFWCLKTGTTGSGTLEFKMYVDGATVPLFTVRF
jgi:hypothetical protein